MKIKIFQSGKNIIFCWLIFLVWGVYLFNFSYFPKIKALNHNKDLPEESFGLSPDYFYSFLDKIGETGQSAYRNFQILDFLNGFLLGLTILASIYFILHKLKAKKFCKALLIFPVSLIIFDWIENLQILYLLSNLPNKLKPTVETLSLFTNIKLIVGSLAFLIFIISGLILTFKLIVKRKKTNAKS